MTDQTRMVECEQKLSSLRLQFGDCADKLRELKRWKENAHSERQQCLREFEARLASGQRIEQIDAVLTETRTKMQQWEAELVERNRQADALENELYSVSNQIALLQFEYAALSGARTQEPSPPKH